MRGLFFTSICCIYLDADFFNNWTSVAEETGSENVVQHGGDEVRPPLPVIREALYDDIMLYGYDFSLDFGFFFVSEDFHSILRNRILALYLFLLPTSSYAKVDFIAFFYIFIFWNFVRCLLVVLSYNCLSFLF